jgi:hypothetical protein
MITVSGAAQSHAFWKFLRRESKPGFVLARVCELSQTLEEAQGLKHCGVDPDAHAMVAGLDSPESRSACEGSLRNNFSRQASAAASVADV